MAKAAKGRMTEEEIRKDERKKIAARLLASSSHKMHHMMNGDGFSPGWCSTCKIVQSLGFTMEEPKKKGKPKKAKPERRRTRKRK